eukprot:5576879-Pyramimonas_sp.AAC.1
MNLFHSALRCCDGQVLSHCSAGGATGAAVGPGAAAAGAGAAAGAAGVGAAGASAAPGAAGAGTTAMPARAGAGAGADATGPSAGATSCESDGTKIGTDESPEGPRLLASVSAACKDAASPIATSAWEPGLPSPITPLWEASGSSVPSASLNSLSKSSLSSSCWYHGTVAESTTVSVSGGAASPPSAHSWRIAAWLLASSSCRFLIEVATVCAVRMICCSICAKSARL